MGNLTRQPLQLLNKQAYCQVSSITDACWQHDQSSSNCAVCLMMLSTACIL